MNNLETVEVGPEAGAQASVIWLHGLGADGHDFEEVVPLLGLPQDIRFVFPHATRRPVTINNGMVMRAWYDILGQGLNAQQDEEGVRESATQIEGLIERELKRGVPLTRIILGGFSQGGAMTLFVGLRYPWKLAGLMVLSGYLPVAEVTLAEMNKENTSIPVLMAHGNSDPMVPMGLAMKSRQRLEVEGMSINWQEYPMQHSVCPQELKDIAVWIRQVLQLEAQSTL